MWYALKNSLAVKNFYSLLAMNRVKKLWDLSKKWLWWYFDGKNFNNSNSGEFVTTPSKAEMSNTNAA